MRHRVAGRGLGRTSSHRKALIRNQVTDLLRHDRIVTTEAKAKTIRPAAEKVITLGKRGTLHARRQAEAILTDRRVLRRVFDDIAPRFQTRPGGYTRIVKLGPRQGDGARMALIELVDGPVAAAASVAPAAPEVVEETAPAAEDIAADDAADEVETTDAADEGDAAEASSEAEAELDAAGADVAETDADASDAGDADDDTGDAAAAEAATTDDAAEEPADDASDDETESEEEKA